VFFLRRICKEHKMMDWNGEDTFRRIADLERRIRELEDRMRRQIERLEEELAAKGWR